METRARRVAGRGRQEACLFQQGRLGSYIGFRDRLGIPTRLGMFVQICEGVQHAHQKGIVHHDLKPSDILVAVEDERPVPRIIDFGVAKATQYSLAERSLYTQLVQWVGTPEFMSPEQAELTGLHLDTQTDVYALGVILYQLLAGVLPFEFRSPRQEAFDEIRRRIREEDPPKPSTRVSMLGKESTAVMAQRRTELPSLRRRPVRRGGRAEFTGSTATAPPRRAGRSDGG